MKTSGNKNGESLVMIHGWGMNSGAWASVRPALEAEYFLHWVDLPGYGINSDIHANSMRNIVDLLCPFIPNDAHLIAWSLGGLVAQALAEKLQDTQANKLKSITLVASSLKFSQSDDWKQAISMEILNNFSKDLKEDSKGTLKRFVALQFMGIKGTKDLQRTLIDDILASSTAIKPNWAKLDSIGMKKKKHPLSKGQDYKTSKNRGGGNDITHKSPHFQALTLGLDILTHADYRKTSYNVPQHWIFADKDRLIPPSVINDLKLLRPDDQITLLENAGHAPFMTQAEDFLTCMSPFIASHR